LPLLYQPGERWLYNTGADVLGVLIARASGQALDVFLQERVFEPLLTTDAFAGPFPPPAVIQDFWTCIYTALAD
jgi:CubicO group peptidase (beta-lactamase class C family)